VEHQAVEQFASLDTLGAGAAREKFDAELQAVLANIRDPNTEAEAKRRIVMEFVLLPNADREVVTVAISAKSVLAATRPTGDVMWLGTRDGQPIATVVHPAQDPRQGVLPLTERQASSE